MIRLINGIPHKTCQICQGDMEARSPVDFHYLCQARQRNGRPTPKIEVVQLSDADFEAFKTLQAKQMGLCDIIAKG